VARCRQLTASLRQPNLEIELHLDDIATAAVALGHRADVIEPLDFLIPYMLEQDL
jgi:hypothetical protein